MAPRRPRRRRQLPERFVSALRAGGRYVRYSPVMRRMLLRTALFLVPASALWALLPLVATQRLNMGASGYGLLLGALGVGAVAGSFLLPQVRAKLSANRLLVAASLVYAAVMVVIVLVPNVVVASGGIAASGVRLDCRAVDDERVACNSSCPNGCALVGSPSISRCSSAARQWAPCVWGFVAAPQGVLLAFLIAAALMVGGRGHHPDLAAHRHRRHGSRNRHAIRARACFRRRCRPGSGRRQDHVHDRAGTRGRVSSRRWSGSGSPGFAPGRRSGDCSATGRRRTTSSSCSSSPRGTSTCASTRTGSPAPTRSSSTTARSLSDPAPTHVTPHRRRAPGLGSARGGGVLELEPHESLQRKAETPVRRARSPSGRARTSRTAALRPATRGAMYRCCAPMSPTAPHRRMRHVHR